MEIRRNDPCLCGSGKKYKKCCLKSENVIELQQVKKERFVQQKHALVLKLKDFINQQVSFSEYMKLRGEFRKRSQHTLDTQLEDAFVDYWLHFFYRYENGLRGIEWFYNQNETRLHGEEKALVKQWTSLVPKVLQAVDATEHDVTFKEVHTGEVYEVQRNKEDIGDLLPWYGTISLIEPYQDKSYFNGVRVFRDAKSVERMETAIQELMSETAVSREETMFTYYPELLAVLLDGALDEESHTPMEIKTITATFKLGNGHGVERLLTSSSDFVIDEWDEDKKVATWSGNWKEYKDNEMVGAVHLAEVFGSIVVEKDQLIFSSYDEEKAEDFKSRLTEWSNAITLADEKVEKYEVPYQVGLKQSFARLTTKETPEYFATYAQLDLLNEIDQPIPKYDNLSLRRLVETGRTEVAESWLRQSECNAYRMVIERYNEVNVTADFNTVRRELGLPLSPFVTGGAKRQSTMQSVDSTVVNPKTKTVVSNEDIPVYEALGFTPETASAFFAHDIVEFFKEKVTGKSEATERKYGNSLIDLRGILQELDLTSWNELDEETFKWLVEKGYPKHTEIVNKTQIKDFVSSVKAFAKWLEKHKGVALSFVADVTKKAEPKLLKKV